MITSSDLYCIAMESETAYHLMQELCARLEMPFPPVLEKDTSKRDALPDPFLMGSQPPVSAAFTKE